jgi:hypothetical protein
VGKWDINSNKNKRLTKKIKKPTRKNLIKKLDTVFSIYIRLSNANNKGFCNCFTCGKSLHWKKIQAGHFMSRKHYSTRWDENNVKPQCSSCNVFRYGEQYIFSKNLGTELSEKMLELSREIVKFTDIDLQEMIKKYSDKIKKLEV